MKRKLLANIFQDGMILQRDKAVKIWGFCAAGELVKVDFTLENASENSAIDGKLISESYETKADEDGRWEVVLPPRETKEVWELVISCATCSQRVSNILFGDVWICSGQSNMELTMGRVLDMAYTESMLPDAVISPETISLLRRTFSGGETHEIEFRKRKTGATKSYSEVIHGKEICGGEVPEIEICEKENRGNDYIHQYTVPMSYDFITPQEDVGDGKWMLADTEQIGEFSAVAYFFAKKLYQQFQVPIGLILSAVGGTPVEAWMSQEALAAFPENLALAKQCQEEGYVENVQQMELARESAWYQQADRFDQGLKEQWFLPSYDDESWQETTISASWDENPDLKACGGVWLRYDLEISEEMYGRLQKYVKESEPAVLRLQLGCIVDADFTYVNGELVGHTTYRYPPRNYPIASLKKGRNVIALRILAVNGIGGFVPEKPYRLVAPGVEIPLDERWKYKRAFACQALPATTFFQYKPTGVYHSMIAPLHGYGIKGAIWYQGESNAGVPARYQDKFTAMITDWREKWGQGDFPFLFTQLANYAPKGPIMGWPLLREEQRKTLQLKNTAMAVTIDVGEGMDIHPLNKKAVGERLALAAFEKVYGINGVASGPRIKEVKTVNAEQLRIVFDTAGSSLVLRNGEVLKGFSLWIGDYELPVSGVIEENDVILTSPHMREAEFITYAWADNPYEANLYSQEGLPAEPFKIDKI